MTIGIAWVGTRKDGQEYLYLASDSRVRGGDYLDLCPKILLLPRSDCAICFAGDTGKCYPFMLQLFYAVLAHQPARERRLDIITLKAHILRVFTDIVGSIKEPAAEFTKSDAEFIFGGYSWKKKRFEFWTIQYDERTGTFRARPSAEHFHPLLPRIAFIGDRARDARTLLVSKLRSIGECATKSIEFEPISVLVEMLRDADDTATIGGVPQVVRIAAHMNTRPFVVKQNGVDTLFGRPLFDYENTDYPSLDLDTMKVGRPRKFGARDRTSEEEDD